MNAVNFDFSDDDLEGAAQAYLADLATTGRTVSARELQVVVELTGVPLERLWQLLRGLRQDAAGQGRTDREKAAEKMVADYRLLHHKLTEAQAAEIAATTEVPRYRVWEFNKQLAAAELQQANEEHWNLFERLDRLGPERGMILDSTFEALVFWCGGQVERFRELLEANGYDVPSPSWFTRHWGRAPRGLRCGAKTGLTDKQKNLIYCPREIPPVGSVVEIDEVFWDCEFLAPNGIDTTPKTKLGRRPTAKERRDAEVVRMHALLAVDVGSGRIIGVALMPRAATHNDYFALLADICEPFWDQTTQRWLGGPPDLVVLDNSGIFGQTKDDPRWLQLHDDTDMSLSLRVNPPREDRDPAVPSREAHPPFWWTGKPMVEGAARITQEAGTLGLAGRLTKNTRLNGTEAHNTVDLLPWRTGVWITLRAIARVNAKYSRTLGMSRDEYYQRHCPPRSQVSDAVLASWYQPHWFAGSKRDVSEEGVWVDNGRWQGEATDVAYNGDWRTGIGTRAVQGDEVEVRVLNHHRNWNYYKPIVASRGYREKYMAKLAPGSPEPDWEALQNQVEAGYKERYLPVLDEDTGHPPFGWKPDRLAVRHRDTKEFMGWNYAPGAMPEDVRTARGRNRTEIVKAVRRNQAEMRDAEAAYTRQIRATGNTNMLDAYRGPGTASAVPPDSGPAEGSDPSAGKASPPPEHDSGPLPERKAGRRPPTRRSGRSAPGVPGAAADDDAGLAEALGFSMDDFDDGPTAGPDDTGGQGR